MRRYVGFLIALVVAAMTGCQARDPGPPATSSAPALSLSCGAGRELCATFELGAPAEVPTVIQLNLRRPSPQGEAFVAVKTTIAPGRAPGVSLVAAGAPPGTGATRAVASGRTITTVVARQALPPELRHLFDEFAWEAQTYVDGPGVIQYSDCAPDGPDGVTYPGGRTVRPANPAANCF